MNKLSEIHKRCSKAFTLNIEHPNGEIDHLILEEFFVNSEGRLIMRYIDKEGKIRVIKEYMLHGSGYYYKDKKFKKSEYSAVIKNHNIVIRKEV